MDRMLTRQSLLLTSNAALHNLTVRAQPEPDWEDMFYQGMASRTSESSLTGALGGYLTQQENRQTTTILTDHRLSSFTVSATFVNPLSLTDTHWDFGVCFHWVGPLSGDFDQVEVVTVDSTGRCYYAPDPPGIAMGKVQIDNFDNTPGAWTTIDLWVEAGLALVGVNNAYRVKLDLNHPAASSGVAVGTGFIDLARRSGREIGVVNCEVWSI
jgi:hypothetical protein